MKIEDLQTHIIHKIESYFFHTIQYFVERGHIIKGRYGMNLGTSVMNTSYEAEYDIQW